MAYCLPFLSSSSHSFRPCLSHFLFSSKAYWFWQLSVHHEFSCHWNKNMTRYTTTTQDWVWSDKLSVDVIPLVSLPLNRAQEVGYILSFVTFSCNTPRVYFSLQKGQQACNENVTTSDGHWQMESGYALCIYRWVDGWMMGEERNSRTLHQQVSWKHFVSQPRWAESLHHRQSSGYSQAFFFPYKIYCTSEQSLQDPYITFYQWNDDWNSWGKMLTCATTPHNRTEQNRIFKDI